MEDDSNPLQQPRLGIFLFILVALLIGVILILVAAFYYKGTYLDTVLSSIGATLIGVGIIDVVSEVFIRPGVITVMRRSFPLFSDPSKVPKDTLRRLMVNIVGELSPKKEFKEDFMKFFEGNIVEAFREYYRENFDIHIKLKRDKIGTAEVVKTKTEWTYDVHNITDKTVTYPIPFRSETWSFVKKGVQLKDHMKIEKMQVTRHKDKTQTPEDVGQEFGVYAVAPKPKDSVLVVLELDKKPVVQLPPHETVTVFVKYSYLAELCDDHTQRMSLLTKNVSVTLDYDEEDFSLDIDEFCVPKMIIAEEKHSFQWKGWFLPSSGFVAFWKTKELP